VSSPRDPLPRRGSRAVVDLRRRRQGGRARHRPAVRARKALSMRSSRRPRPIAHASFRVKALVRIVTADHRRDAWSQSRCKSGCRVRGGIRTRDLRIMRSPKSGHPWPVPACELGSGALRSAQIRSTGNHDGTHAAPAGHRRGWGHGERALGSDGPVRLALAGGTAAAMRTQTLRLTRRLAVRPGE
jgi:hypothetical protein